MADSADGAERRRKLREAFEGFVGSVEALPEGSFLRVVDGRSPRDVVAHLIGWNSAAVAGYEQQRRGETPSYLVDPGPDWSHFNAESLRRYPSRDRAELLAELRRSFAEYDAFLRALPPAEWDASHGATFRDRPVTPRRLAGGLTHDYTEHREELEHWPCTAIAS